MLSLEDRVGKERVEELVARRERLRQKWRGLHPGEAGWFCYVSLGWDIILDELFTDLRAMGWNGGVHQVKQKHGTLRVYLGPGSDQIWDRVYTAERKSAETCEDCGEPGWTRDGNWVRTLCNRCHVMCIDDIKPEAEKETNDE